MGAPTAKFSRKTYELVLEGFRDSPGNIAHAARHAGVDWQTAKRLWDVGWPKFTWARPMREVVEEERQKALAEVAARLQKEKELHEADREKTRAMAVEQKAAEEQLLIAARKNVAAAFGLSAKLVPAMDGAVGYIRQVFLNPDGTQKSAKDVEAAGIDPKTAVSILRQHAGILARATGVMETLIQLGRTQRNEPNAIVGHVVADMSAEEAAEEIEAQEAAIAIIRSEGERKPAAANGSTNGAVH